MRTLSRAVLLAAVAATTAVLPATAATAAPAGPSGANGDPEIIKTCGKGYSGYIRRFGKDALCLRPGTRTWAGFKAFECKGNITVYFKEGQKIQCGGGVNFPYYGGVVKTVAR